MPPPPPLPMYTTPSRCVLLPPDVYTRRQVDMGIEGAARVSEININMNQRKVCQHPVLFGEPKDKVTGVFAGEANPEVNQNASVYVST